MDNPVKLYDELMARVVPPHDDEAVRHLGSLVDCAGHLGRREGLERAVAIGGGILGRSQSGEHAFLTHYFLANAWACVGNMAAKDSATARPWESHEGEKELFHLRTALKHQDAVKAALRCPVLTNLGNLMSTLGRQVEAIAYWDRALEIAPDLGMARGNRGRGVFYCAAQVQDGACRHELLRRAWKDLSEALGSKSPAPFRAHAGADRPQRRTRVPRRGFRPGLVPGGRWR